LEVMAMDETDDELPETVKEAVNVLLSSFLEEDKETLRNTPEADLTIFHYGLGTYIRNEFGLWSGNKELLKSCASQMFPKSAYDEYLAMMVDPDSASMEIIKATWRRLRRE